MDRLMSSLGQRGNKAIPRFSLCKRKDCNCSIRVLLVLLFCLSLPTPASAESNPPVFRILVLYSFNDETPWHQRLESGFRSQFEKNNINLEMHSLYMDGGRFPNNSLDSFRVFIKDRYNDYPIDLVIADSTESVSFLANSPELLPDIPRIYIVNGQYQNINLIPLRSIDKVIPLREDFGRSIQGIRRLTGSNKIYVVGEDRSMIGAVNLDGFKKAAVIYEPGVEFEYLVNYSLDDLQKKVQTLEPDSAIFYTIVMLDGNNENYIPFQFVQKINDYTSVPVFSAWESLLGSGVVGGFLISAELTGIQLANEALSILIGHPVDPTHNVISGNIYDWRALQRWDIDESLLPLPNIIRFRQPSVFEIYRIQIYLVLSLVIILAMVTFVLFIFERKRKWALDELEEQRRLLEVRVHERTQELNEARLKAEQDARTDDLSGLNNRRSFFDSGYMVHEQAKRYRRHYSVIMLDLDRFKNINDQFGHSVGDQVIEKLAELIRQNIRSVDIPGRIGGEEFAIIQQESNIHVAMQFAERLRHQIEQLNMDVDGQVISFTSSFGVACYRDTDDAFNDVLARADLALYEAKEQGRNRVVEYKDEMLKGRYQRTS